MRTDVTVEPAAECAVHYGTEQCDSTSPQHDRAAFEDRAVPRNTAVTGLAVAIPISILLWTAIAVVAWLLLR